MPFVIGENIGPYRLVEQLGQGGMATVFKAYHLALDRYIAIKALHPVLTSEPNFLARFQREAQVVARQEQPNIVPIYDYSEYEGRPYLVMEFIDGETLKAHLKRSPLNKSEHANIVDSVGAVLSSTHTQGVLHRDVKPSNVLRAAIRRIKTQYPDNPTVQLLNAELLGQSGDVQQAQVIFTSLIDDPITPPWVRRIADYLLNKAKN